MNNIFNISMPRYCIRQHVWDIKKKPYSLFYLLFKSNWTYYILSDNPTPDPNGTWSAEVDLYEVSLTSLLRNSWKPQRMFVCFTLPVSQPSSKISVQFSVPSLPWGPGTPLFHWQALQWFLSFHNVGHCQSLSVLWYIWDGKAWSGF